MYYFCTYFDQYYLSRGLALYKSLSIDSNFRLYVLCLDALTYNLLKKQDLNQIELIQIEELENDYPELLNVKSTRSIIEYYFTCSPLLPLYIFKRFKDVDRVTYLDADTYFFSDYKNIFNEIIDSSIALVEHSFKYLEKKNLRYGRYNVGVISFARDEEGLACLEDWKDKCIDWCYDKLDDGRYADQKYLDAWPDKYRKLTVINNPGINSAPWNISSRQINIKDDVIFIGNKVLILYHFHGLKKINKYKWNTNLGCHLVNCRGHLREKIYKKYIQELIKIESSLEYDMNHLNADLIVEKAVRTKFKLGKKIIYMPLNWLLKSYISIT